MSSAVEFRVTPEKVASEEVNNARYLAAEGIANLLNVLAPEQLEFIHQQLLRVNSPQPYSTANKAALVAELTEGFQVGEQEQQELELVSLLRHFEWRRRLLKSALSASQVAQLLGTSRQTPHDRAKSGTLLAVFDRGVWRFPSWQFDPEGPDGTIDGLPEVLQSLHVSLLAKLNWLVSPNQVLDGQTPVEALKGGQKERVLSEAVSVGVI